VGRRSAVVIGSQRPADERADTEHVTVVAGSLIAPEVGGMVSMSQADGLDPVGDQAVKRGCDREN
jgi:hypothetical protein